MNIDNLLLSLYDLVYLVACIACELVNPLWLVLGSLFHLFPCQILDKPSRGKFGVILWGGYGVYLMITFSPSWWSLCRSLVRLQLAFWLVYSSTPLIQALISCSKSQRKLICLDNLQHTGSIQENRETSWAAVEKPNMKTVNILTHCWWQAVTTQNLGHL